MTTVHYRIIRQGQELVANALDEDSVIATGQV